MLFGTNQNHYPEMAAKVHGMTIQRSYKPLAAGWPVMPAGQVAHWSIRPDHDELLAGGLDAQLTEAIAQAPPGSLLTGWHEAEHAGWPGTVAAQQARVHAIHAGTVAAQQARVHAIHAHLHALVHATRPGEVLYGPVTTMGAGRGWVLPGMDFYGVDVYDLHGRTDPATALDIWSAKMPDGHRVVAETNSQVQGHRPRWFQAVYEWLAASHGIAMETFWNPDGPLSGPWVDDDWPTISALRRVAESAGRPPWTP
jgi:hypothetical protein